MIYLTGDVHGQMDIYKLTKEHWKEQFNLTRNDYLIQLGDLGLLWRKDKTFDYLMDFYTNRKYTMLWIDGNHPLSKDTEILTNKGFINIVNVYNSKNNEYQLAEFDLNTREIDFSEPIKKWKTHYDRGILIEGRRTKQFVSRDHSVVIDNKKLIAETLLGKEIKEYEVPISGYYETEGIVINISNNFLKFLIWVMVHGKRDAKNSKETNIFFRFYNPDRIDDLKELLKDTDIKYEIWKAKGKIRKYPPYIIKIDSEVSKIVLKILTDKCDTLPEEFRLLNKQQFLTIIREIEIASNNSDKMNIATLITSSRMTTDIIQELCIYYGYYTEVSVKMNKNDKEFYSIHISKKPYADMNLNIKEINDYNDFMYCFSMPKGTLITRNDYKIAFTGNCNFDMLKEYPISEWNNGKVQFISDNIIHLMRGQVYTIDGYKFLTIGGAKSIDKESRIENVSWWKEEELNYSEQEETYNNLELHNNTIDFILTHAAPFSILQPMFNVKKDLLYNSTTETFLDDIYQITSFNHWYFGHYHVDKDFNKFSCLYNRIVPLIKI